MKTLILGGARSGKSRYAENLAIAASDKQVVYVATGWAGDSEMQARIEHHKARRPSHWKTVEEPINLAKTLLKLDSPNHFILVDCLTLWLSNCLEKNCFEQQRTELLSSLQCCQADIALVSNEVGSGIIPLGELSRQFADNSGRLHQHLATLCDSVTLVVAGLPLHLKP